MGVLRPAQGPAGSRGSTLMGDHCEQTMRKLSVYIDRELSDAEVRSVKADLDDCPPCEEVFDFQAVLKRLVCKECCTADAPTRLLDSCRQLATEIVPALVRVADVVTMMVDL